MRRSRPEGSAPFFITRWHLSTVTHDGTPVEVTPDLDPWVFGPENTCRFNPEDCCPFGPSDCPRGPMVAGSDTCNRFRSSVNLEGDRVTSGQWSASTAVGCTDTELQTAFDQLRRGDGFMVEVAGNTLRASGSGVDLVFNAGGPFAGPGGPILDSGRVGDVEYRLTWNGGIIIEWVDTSTASGIGLTGHKPAENTLAGFFIDLGSGHLLVAALPDAAANAVYVADDGQSIPLTLLGKEGAPVAAAKGLFEQDPGPGVLVALDGAGTALASIRMVGAEHAGLASLAE